MEIALIGEAAVKYKLRAGEEKFEINGNINKAYPKLTVSLSQTTCTVGEKLLPLLSVSGVQGKCRGNILLYPDQSWIFGV